MMDNELETMKKKADMIYFKIISYHLLGDTEKLIRVLIRHRFYFQTSQI
jgi:hypothetical protein